MIKHKKVKTAAHKMKHGDEKQDKALFGKMMKKEMPKIKKMACK